jgi:hypothetical protein
MPEGWRRPVARSPEDLSALHQLCREGRLCDVERWIDAGKPLQVSPEAILAKPADLDALANPAEVLILLRQKRIACPQIQLGVMVSRLTSELAGMTMN